MRFADEPKAKSYKPQCLTLGSSDGQALRYYRAPVHRDRANPMSALRLGSALACAATAFTACVPEGPRTDTERAKPDETQVGPRTTDLDPALRTTFRDEFEREALGSNWRALSTRWRVAEGQLCGRGAQNRGVWLRHRLPTNVRIAFDARSDSEEGDLKVEVFGDGLSGATKNRYDDATGYLLIFGGWHNSMHVLARQDEHGADRLISNLAPGSATVREHPVRPHRAYRFRIERTDDNRLRWWVDGELIFERIDEEPLVGLGHDHFGFNNWNAPVCFDNLEIEPL
jgi:hypothetical protein